MARETKVGLLAGLAFIVCFAVILTNKGQRVPFRPSQQVVDATRQSRQTSPSAAAGMPRAPLGRQAPRQDRVSRQSAWRPTVNDTGVVDGDGVLGQPSARDAAMRRNAQRQLPQRNQTRQLSRQPQQTTMGTYRSTDSGIGGSVTPAPTSLSSRQSGQDRRPSDSAITMSPPLSQPTNRSGSNEPVTRNTPTGRQTPARSAIATGRPPVTTAPRGRRVGAKYTVAPGDTLSRIAANHYGRATTANVNAIVSANRTTIKNPDVLHSGVVIVIPVPNEATGVPVGSVTSKKKSTKPSSNPRRAASFAWYQIRPNDRYISIAREQLGDASRWEEIHALNREKFPDPGKIRVGVRIKLPLVRSASAGGRH